MNNKVFFYGGLPRSGSHFLSSILNQNPDIYSEGSSSLCRILWDISKIYDSQEIITELGYFNRNNEVIKSKTLDFVIDEYYKEAKNKKYIIDKNRSWTMPDNVNMIKKYICPDPKFIIIERDIEEIVKSFLSIYLSNGIDQSFAENEVLNLYSFGTNPLMRPIAATIYANINEHEQCFFIQYDDLVNNTKSVVDDLYDFLRIGRFNHDYKKIGYYYLENNMLTLNGIAQAGKNIHREQHDVTLSDRAIQKINEINKFIKISKKKEITKQEKNELIVFCQQNSF